MQLPGFSKPAATWGLTGFLEEAAYVREGGSSRVPEFVSLDRLTAIVNWMPALKPVHCRTVKVLQPDGFVFNRQGVEQSTGAKRFSGSITSSAPMARRAQSDYRFGP